MTNAKITKKDKFTMIKAMIEAGTVDGVDTDMLVEFCDNEIALLDKKAAKAKETASKKKADGDALTDAVAAVLTDELQTIAEITDAVDAEDATTAKVAYRLNALVKAGVAEKAEVTISGGEGTKARKVQAYKVANAQ
jgi:hypothetical protein